MLITEQIRKKRKKSARVLFKNDVLLPKKGRLNSSTVECWLDQNVFRPTRCGKIRQNTSQTISWNCSLLQETSFCKLFFQFFLNLGNISSEFSINRLIPRNETRKWIFVAKSIVSRNGTMGPIDEIVVFAKTWNDKVYVCGKKKLRNSNMGSKSLPTHFFTIYL